MDEDKIKTEAELQIERLKKMREAKEEKNKKIMIDAFTPPQRNIENKIKIKRQPRMICIDKDVFEKIHQIVSKINNKKNMKKISKKRFINALLKEILKLDLKFEEINDLNEIKKIFEKIHIE
jgi:hypothetical protein